MNVCVKKRELNFILVTARGYEQSPSAIVMTPPSAWFDSKMAYTADEMYAGNGCHPDEAQALSDYLRGHLTKFEAAQRITAAIVSEKSPSQATYRLWGLLSEALVELSDEDRHKTLDLLEAIRTLSPAIDIDWAELPGFGNMWYDLYRFRIQGGCGIIVSDPKDEVVLRKECEATGRAEAEMLLRGLDVANEQWGFEVVNLVCSDGPELEIMISEVFAWLDVAAWKLKEKIKSETPVQEFVYSLNGDYTKRHTVEATLSEHWASWKDRIWRISQGETGLSKVARRLAAQSHDLM
jgi:hypothetical protein